MAVQATPLTRRLCVPTASGVIAAVSATKAATAKSINATSDHGAGAFASFTPAFNAWAQETVAVAPAEHVAVDGKSIKASVSDNDQPDQAFVSVVSAFSVAQGVVVSLEMMPNQHTSEIKTVAVRLERLQLKGVCLSLDALHTQKTVAHSISSGNDYVMTVKGNQPTLFEQLKRQFEYTPPLSGDRQTERTRARQTQRMVRVLDTVVGLDPHWVGVQRARASGTGWHQSHATLSIDDVRHQCALTRCRRLCPTHAPSWHIENRLHWVKAVVLKEDQAP